MTDIDMGNCTEDVRFKTTPEDHARLSMVALATGEEIASRMRAVRLVRRTDPVTSAAAAERVTAIGSRQDHLARIVRAVRQHPGRTSAELAQLADLDRVEAARRTADAANQSLIQRGNARVCRVKGTKAITWWPVPTDAQRECLRGAA